MNWGKGIIAGMAVFMLFIIGMGIYMFSVPADDYDHQYYEKGLNFNQEYQREQRVNNDNAAPVISQQNGEMHLQFTRPVVGSIKFMRPSSQQMDKVFALNTRQDSTVVIPLNSVAKGLWQLTLQWKSDYKDYLYKKEVLVK